MSPAGDLDLVLGSGDGLLNYIENTGTSTAPVFVLRTGSANPFDGINVGEFSTPAFSDIDGDGTNRVRRSICCDRMVLYFPQATWTSWWENGERVFLVASSTTLRTPGRLRRRRSCNGPAARTPSTPSMSAMRAPPHLPILMETVRSDRVRRSINCDTARFASRAGNLDLVVGNLDGSLNYFENTGTPTAPAFVQRTGIANPFDGIDVRARSIPALGDVDDDGTLTGRRTTRPTQTKRKRIISCIACRRS